MNHGEMFLFIMRYLFRREDTSTPVVTGASLCPACRGGIEHDRPWLGVVKAVLWSIIAIFVPLVFAMLTK